MNDENGSADASAVVPCIFLFLMLIAALLFFGAISSSWWEYVAVVALLIAVSSVRPSRTDEGRRTYRISVTALCLLVAGGLIGSLGPKFEKWIRANVQESQQEYRDKSGLIGVWERKEDASRITFAKDGSWEWRTGKYGKTGFWNGQGSSLSWRTTGGFQRDDVNNQQQPEVTPPPDGKYEVQSITDDTAVLRHRTKNILIRLRRFK